MPLSAGSRPSVYLVLGLAAVVSCGGDKTTFVRLQINAGPGLPSAAALEVKVGDAAPVTDANAFPPQDRNWVKLGVPVPAGVASPALVVIARDAAGCALGRGETPPIIVKSGDVVEAAVTVLPTGGCRATDTGDAGAAVGGADGGASTNVGGAGGAPASGGAGGQSDAGAETNDGGTDPTAPEVLLTVSPNNKPIRAGKLQFTAVFGARKPSVATDFELKRGAKSFGANKDGAWSLTVDSSWKTASEPFVATAIDVIQKRVLASSAPLVIDAGALPAGGSVANTWSVKLEYYGKGARDIGVSPDGRMFVAGAEASRSFIAWADANGEWKRVDNDQALGFDSLSYLRPGALVGARNGSLVWVSEVEFGSMPRFAPTWNGGAGVLLEISDSSFVKVLRVNDGHVVVCASSSSTSAAGTSRRMVVQMLFSVDGSSKWRTILGTEDEFPTACELDGAGGVWIAGTRGTGGAAYHVMADGKTSGGPIYRAEPFSNVARRAAGGAWLITKTKMVGVTPAGSPEIEKDNCAFLSPTRAASAPAADPDAHFALLDGKYVVRCDGNGQRTWDIVLPSEVATIDDEGYVYVAGTSGPGASENVLVVKKLNP